MCKQGYYYDGESQPPCKECRGSESCDSLTSYHLTTLNGLIESGDVKGVIAGLEGLTGSEENLSPNNVRRLIKTLSSISGLLKTEPQYVELEALCTAIIDSIEVLKDGVQDFLSDKEKCEIIEIIEAVSMSLKDGQSITTSSLVAQSIDSKQKEVELRAPEAVPKADLPLKLYFGGRKGQRANVAVLNESYKNILPSPGVNATIGSPIVSVTFSDLQQGSEDTSRFHLIFKQTDRPVLSGYTNLRRCVYLDTKTGKWLEDGLNITLNADETCTCTSTHTTSFAILMSPTKIPESHQRTQEIVSYIMFAINLAFLSLSFCLIAPFKKLTRKQAVKIQLGLVLTLILGYTSFSVISATVTVTVDGAGNPLLSLNVGCVAGVIITQYFFLSAFFWMGCTAWTFFNKIVRAIETYGRADNYFFLKCAAISWISPIIFPVTALLLSQIPISNDNHSRPFVGEKDKNGASCWVNGPWKFIGFLVPAFLIILFNSVCFLMVGKVIIRSRKPDSGDKEAIRRVKAMMMVAVIVGIPWIVAGLSFGPVANVMQHLFIILVGLQGPILFLVLVMSQEDVKANTVKLARTWFANFKRATFETKNSSAASSSKASSSSQPLKSEALKMKVSAGREPEMGRLMCN